MAHLHLSAAENSANIQQLFQPAAALVGSGICNQLTLTLPEFSTRMNIGNYSTTNQREGEEMNAV
jgi:hypothetical protein